MRTYAPAHGEFEAGQGTKDHFKTLGPCFQEYFVETMKKLDDPGLLLVSTNKKGKSNVMSIGWGFIGVFGGKLVFMVSLDYSSYTREFIEESGEFTVNVPGENMSDVVKHCGSVSGRVHDKFSECKLELLKSRIVKADIIAQCRLHYECRVINKLNGIPDLFSTKTLFRVLVKKMRSILHFSNNHSILYFGEIMAVYRH